MKNKINIKQLCCGAILTSFLLVSPLHAADQPADFKADKTGTNPVNFTTDFRVYNEYQWLNTDGDGVQNITTIEHRRPFADGKWQFRIRARATYLEADFNNDGIDDVDEFGLGDIDFRFLTVPYVDMSKGLSVAVGLETFLPTASDDALGSEALVFGPQAFFVKFTPFGLKGTLIAGAYQHKFSVYEEDDNAINQGLFDVFFLLQADNKQTWILFNPQAVIDYDENKEFGFIEAEAGMMVDKYFGTKGHSISFRPSIGYGNDRPADGSIELGYKVIW